MNKKSRRSLSKKRSNDYFRVTKQGSTYGGSKSSTRIKSNGKKVILHKKLQQQMQMKDESEFIKNNLLKFSALKNKDDLETFFEKLLEGLNDDINELSKNKYYNLLYAIYLSPEFNIKLKTAILNIIFERNIEVYQHLVNDLLSNHNDDYTLVFEISTHIDQRSWDYSIKNKIILPNNELFINRGKIIDKGYFLDPELFKTSYNRFKIVEKINEFYKRSENRAIATECRVLQEIIIRDIILKYYPNPRELLERNDRSLEHTVLIENLFSNHQIVRLASFEPREDNITYYKNKMLNIKNWGNFTVHNPVFPNNPDIESLKEDVNSIFPFLMEIEKNIR